MLLLTLRGTPTLYYGDELGMHDVAIPPERVQDPQEKNEPGKGLGRDPERTPMQWDAGRARRLHHGRALAARSPTTTAERNVEAERDDPDSMLSLYRRLLELRRARARAERGRATPRWAPPATLLAYRREPEGRAFLVALNLGHQPGVLAPGARAAARHAWCSAPTAPARGSGSTAAWSWARDEGVVVRLD